MSNPDPAARSGAVSFAPAPERYNADLLHRVAPRYITNKDKGDAQSKIIQAVGSILNKTLAKYSLNYDLRAAHFIAQCCEESEGFSRTEEHASGAEYEGRDDLGNTEDGDGVRFKGRGIIQLTGRGNYTAYGKLTGLDLVNNPVLAADPATSLVIACEYWTKNNLNLYADQDDVLSISKITNTGSVGTTMPNGLEARKRYLEKAKAALGMPGSGAASAAVRLKRNDVGAAVEALQRALVGAGYKISIDGNFGQGTQAAVQKFQREKGLHADGVAGPKTLAALGLA
jgi:putative chitinase